MCIYTKNGFSKISSYLFIIGKISAYIFVIGIG